MRRSMQTKQYTPISSAQQGLNLPPADEDVSYMDDAQVGFDEPESADLDEGIDGNRRFRVAIGAFNLISILAGLAFILVMVALLISLITWLQGDISQSFTLLTSNLQ
jgi:hypothetical protein